MEAYSAVGQHGMCVDMQIGFNTFRGFSLCFLSVISSPRMIAHCGLELVISNFKARTVCANVVGGDAWGTGAET